MLLQFAQWAETSGFGTALRESPWAFAVIESVHLLGLSVLGGSALVVDLRLLGVGLTRHPVAAIARDAARWQNWSVVVMVLTGLGLFFSESVKCYYSTPFWVKMATLSAAIFFTYAVRRRVIAAPEGSLSRLAQATVAIVSIALWFVVGASGRWIGFSG